MTQRLPRVYRNFEEFEQSERGGAPSSHAPLSPLSIDQMLEMAFPSATVIAIDGAQQRGAPFIEENVATHERPDNLPDNLIELFEIRGPVRFG